MRARIRIGLVTALENKQPFSLSFPFGLLIILLAIFSGEEGKFHGEIESRDSWDGGRARRCPRGTRIPAVWPRFIPVEQIRRGWCSSSYAVRVYRSGQVETSLRHLESRCTNLYQNITVSYRCRVARSCPSLPFSFFSLPLLLFLLLLIFRHV